MSLGEVNLVSEANLRAAGKGINVAMVLKDLGREVGVTGWLGADNEQSFVSLFAERALDDHFVRVAGSTRINVKISEQSGRVTDLNLPGLTIQQGEVSALEQAIDQLAPHADWFVLAGSLPKGVAPDYCAHLIRLLKAKGKQVIFDCSGAALSEGIKAAPTLVKPNLEELEPVGGPPHQDPERAGRVCPRVAGKRHSQRGDLQRRRWPHLVCPGCRLAGHSAADAGGQHRGCRRFAGGRSCPWSEPWLDAGADPAAGHRRLGTWRSVRSRSVLAISVCSTLYLNRCA